MTMGMAVVLIAINAGCPKSGPTDPLAAAPREVAEPEAPTKRSFDPVVNGKPIIRGISYGPFRENQRPGGPNPTRDQILEDLKIVADTWSMIRVYASEEPTETILSTIRDEGIPIVMMVGAWIDPDNLEANEREVETAIRLANAYPEQVVAVSVGNETQVEWSAHRSDRARLIGYLKRTRDAVKQPVTTADDYNFWNKPESHEVADVVDFILLHAYAMWNQQSLENAIPWTDATYKSIQAEHPDHRLVIGETGWATELNPEGEESKYIKAPAGEAEQKVFYEAFKTWTLENNVVHFYFEAFDEPWKGSADPREVEKHWGVYGVDRKPKKAMAPVD